MIGQILGSMIGKQAATEDSGQEKGVGSLLVIGIILFVLLGGLKLLQKTDSEC